MLAPPSLNTQLSIVLPLLNAQETLSLRIGHLLDLLDDLTVHFELVLVDDGSDDLTEEIAVDWTQQYPQIRLVRHRRSLGEETAIQSGITASQSEHVVVLPERTAISAEQLRWCWQMKDKAFHGTSVTVAPTSSKSGLFDRLQQWGEQAVRADSSEQDSPSIRFLRRTTVTQPSESPTDAARSKAAIYQRRDLPKADPPAERPRFLQRLRRFALGE